jgi:hypothetical protein
MDHRAARIARTAAFAGEVLARDGELWCAVATSSMAPVVRPGDRVRLVPLLDAAPRLGELLAVVADGGLLLHRLVARAGAGLVLKGDALAFPDAPVEPGSVLGRVVAIERGGRVVRIDGAVWSVLDRVLAFHSRRCVGPRTVTARRAVRGVARVPAYAVAWTVGCRLRW